MRIFKICNYSFGFIYKKKIKSFLKKQFLNLSYFVNELVAGGPRYSRTFYLRIQDLRSKMTERIIRE